MIQAVEDFVYMLITDVFNGHDTRDRLSRRFSRPGLTTWRPKAHRIEDPAEWTEEKIKKKGTSLASDKGPAGNYED